MDMAHSTIRFATNQSFRDDGIVKDLTEVYDISQNESLINRITSILLISNLALATHLYRERYKNNNNKKKIFYYYDVALKAFFEGVYEKAAIAEVEELLNNMLTEYAEVIRADNWLEDATKILQSRIESEILGLPLTRDLALPLTHAFMLCLMHQSNFMTCLQTVLSKWDIVE